MDEVKRFLRYTIPGIMSITFLLLAICFASNEGISASINRMVEYLKDVGPVVAFIFGSGVMGYVFANIYFAVIWIPGINRITIDYLTFINNMLEKGLVIIDSKGNRIKQGDLSKRDAWTIISLIWNTRRLSDEKIKSCEHAIDRMTDIMHSMGASITGIIIFYVPFISWVLIKKIDLTTPIIITILWFGVVGVFCLGYWHIRAAIGSITNSIIVDILEKEAGAIHYYTTKAKKELSKDDCV